MKIGDTFVANQDFRNFKKNKEYKIRDITTFTKIDMFNSSHLIKFEGDEIYFLETKLNEYFYTLKEYRKLKINKINGNKL